MYIHVPPKQHDSSWNPYTPTETTKAIPSPTYWEQTIHPSYQILQGILKVIQSNNVSIKEKLKNNPYEEGTHCIELLEINENLLAGILK